MLNLNQLKKYYTNSPLWLKKLYASIPFDIRNGSDYRKWKKFLNENVNLEEYEILKLKETVSYAYENTQYYKELFDQLQVSPLDINDKKDLSRLPIMDKDIVRVHYQELIAEDFPSRKTFFVTTGGTSGKPMKFLQSKNVWAKELAFTMNFFGQYGYQPKMLKASFRGGEFSDLKNDIFWKFNPIYNELHFSPFHINANTVEAYVKALNHYKPSYFHSYPSSLTLLIHFMKQKNLYLDYKVNAIFLISENFTGEEIRLIREFFRCEIASFYGHSERLIFAPTSSPELDSFQIDRRYGLFELINSSSETIQENNIVGEMVGTSFDNYALPLIRYRTNDFVAYKNYENDELGQIKGRWEQEYLEGYEGSKIYLTALNMHSDIFANVQKFQFIQEKQGQADILLIVNNLFSKKDEVEILNALNNKAGHAVKFKIRLASQLQTTKRGKFKNIIKTYE